MKLAESGMSFDKADFSKWQEVVSENKDIVEVKDKDKN